MGRITPASLILTIAFFKEAALVLNNTNATFSSRAALSAQQTSYPTFQSMNSYKSIPLTLNYLFDDKHEQTSPSARGVFAMRDILLENVNRNPNVLRPYNVSMFMWNTKYSIEKNLGITIDMFNTHVVRLYSNHQPSSPSCEVDLTTSDDLVDQCSLTSTDIITTAMKASRYSPPLFFGPETNDESDIIGQLAPLSNVVAISAGADAAKLSNRKIYPNFFRTVVSSDSFQAVPRALLSYLNYTTVALAAATSADEDEMYSKADEMEKVDLDLRLQKLQVLFRIKFDPNKPATLDEFSQQIQQTDARVLIIFSNRPTTYKLFCRAVKVFGGVKQFNAKKYLIIFVALDYMSHVIMPDQIDPSLDCTYAQLDAVLNGSLIITHTSWASDNDRLDCCNNMTIARLKNLTVNLSDTRYGEPRARLSKNLPQTIDAFWAGLLALDGVDKRLRAERPAARSLLDFTLGSTDMATMLKNEMNAMRFRGALGEVSFTSTGEFDGRLLIRQYLVRYTIQAGRQTEMVDRFSFLTATNKLVLISAPVFGTRDGRPPADKKPPTVDNTQNQLIIILVCTIGGALLLLAALAYWLYRRNMQQNFANPSWFVPYDVSIIKAGIFASRTSLMGGGASTTGSMAGNQSNLSLSRGLKVAMLNEQPVRMQPVPAVAKLHIDMHNHRTLTAFRDKMIDPNVVRFIGYTIADVAQQKTPLDPVSREQFLLWEHCEKGSLEHLIGGEGVQMMKLDALFEYSILLDVAQGVGFIHKSFIRAHGALSTAACLIDKRFSIKIADYGDPQLAEMFGLDTLLLVNREGNTVTNLNLQSGEKRGSQVAIAGERRLYWAPELLRDSLLLPQYTQEADVYAYAIVVYALVARMDPYEAFSNQDNHSLANGNGTDNHHSSTGDLTIENLLDMIRERHRPAPYRPSIQPLVHSDARLPQLVQRCWSEHPGDRPTMPEIIKQLQSISGIKAGGSVTDQLLLRLERYASDMESLVAERTQELETEKRRTDELLNAMLPAEIAKQLKINGRVEPESFDIVTIYFSDIVGFTTLSGSSTPIEVVNLLNALYTMFDAQIDLFDAYKVETIGDAYMVVSGLPRRNGNKHVVHIAKLSLALLAAIKTFIIPHRPDEKLKLRIGLNTGPCVAGVVGIKMPRYCLFGDTVNTASRMESNGEALRIHISESTKTALDEHDGFVCEERGQLEIKGKGSMTTYWLVS